MEQREEGREGGREEGPGGSIIDDSSNPLLWKNANGAGAAKSMGRSTGRGKSGVCRTGADESSLETTIRTDRDGETGRDCGSDSKLGGGDEE